MVYKLGVFVSEGVRFEPLLTKARRVFPILKFLATLSFTPHY